VMMHSPSPSLRDPVTRDGSQARRGIRPCYIACIACFIAWLAAVVGIPRADAAGQPALAAPSSPPTASKPRAHAELVKRPATKLVRGRSGGTTGPGYILIPIALIPNDPTGDLTVCTRVMNALLRKGIHPFIYGSLGYSVMVPRSQSARAVKVLREDAKAHGYKLRW
jgi:hypothetical protein